MKFCRIIWRSLEAFTNRAFSNVSRYMPEWKTWKNQMIIVARTYFYGTAPPIKLYSRQSWRSWRIWSKYILVENSLPQEHIRLWPTVLLNSHTHCIVFWLQSPEIKKGLLLSKFEKVNISKSMQRMDDLFWNSYEKHNFANLQVCQNCFIKTEQCETRQQI